VTFFCFLYNVLPCVLDSGLHLDYLGWVPLSEHFDIGYVRVLVCNRFALHEPRRRHMNGLDPGLSMNYGNLCVIELEKHPLNKQLTASSGAPSLLDSFRLRADEEDNQVQTPHWSIST
jgi:hypothetical protein